MRIALVCPYDLDLPGGVQTHVRELADELRGDGDDVTVVAPGTDGPGIVALGPSLRVPFNASRAPITVNPAAVRRALDTLRGLDPDVVHVHEPAAPLLSLAVCLRGPRPLVGTFHSWSESDLAYRAARPVARRAATRLDARLAVSPAAIFFHARALGLPAGGFREVPNGVRTQRFAGAEPLPELRHDHAPTLLFVGRLEPRKGVEQLIRAFVALRARQTAVRLLVVGEGPERDRCQALLPAPLRPDVVFLGRVDDRELPRFHASADVFVAPNVGGESFGVVLVEAMAAGLPVVASALPGFRAVVRDGVEGRLVPPGDVAALADALDALLANPALRRAMGAQGREAAARYDWAVVVGRIRDVYVQVTGGVTGNGAPPS